MTLQTGINPWQSHPAVIESITLEVAGVATFRLRLQSEELAASYRFEPGQFNMLWVPGAGEVAISLSADPNGAGPLDHTIRAAGNVTRLLFRQTHGSVIGLRGPYGTSWPLEQAVGSHVILIAGGIGLAPLRPAILALLAQRDRYESLTLLCGARSPDTLLYPAERAEWERGGMKVLTTVDRADGQWKGAVGVVTLLLDRLTLPDPQQTTVFMCGPEIMMRFCALTALDRGIPAENLWLSAERNMQCAVGLCGHCQWGPNFVCREGPVFRYDRIAPFLNVEGL
ncbi:MAG: FAD/NAD(P)-binding protein [Planctomycetaceae bacterium]|nr:FAD/NAD(P)-binding protein [Planctomycetaceae bacterium]